MKRLLVISVLILSLVLLAPAGGQAGDLKFYADVYAWFPDGKVTKASPGDGVYIQGCINPAGTQVIYSGGKSGPPRVWITDLASGKKTALTPDDSGARHPSFSWDGKKIVFISDSASGKKPQTIEQMSATGVSPKDSVTNVFVMDADGSNVSQITKGAFQDSRPVFSPDGKYIAFIRTVDGVWKLFTAPLDGSSEPRLLSTPKWAYRPWFAADGQTIYFQTDVGGRNRIARIPFEGGEIATFKNDDKGNSRGIFADPGGKVLLMHSTRSGDWGIWELPLDGSKLKQLIPPGYKRALHPTRSKNNVLAFDAYRMSIDEGSLITSKPAKGEFRFPGPPAFSVRFPDGVREKSANTKFDQVYSVRLANGFNVQIVVSDIPEGQALKDAGSVYAHEVIADNFDTEVEIVSNVEQTTDDGTKTYLTQFEWEARSGTMITSYVRTAYKDGKLVQVNGHAWGEPEAILKILNSLSFK